jgi:hypothetical protein
MIAGSQAVRWVGADDRVGPSYGIAALRVEPTLRSVLGAARALRGAKVETALVHAYSGDELRWIIAAITLGGVRAALLFPDGADPAIPTWQRRFHRYVVRDQDEARRWSRAGIALGRIVVIQDHPEEALDALLREVGSMSRPPERKRSAINR